MYYLCRNKINKKNMKNVLLVGLLSVSLVATVLVAGNVATSNKVAELEREYQKNAKKMWDIGSKPHNADGTVDFNTLSRRNQEINEQLKTLR